MPFDAVFNANEVTPSQGGSAHPVGNKFPFKITSTEVKATKDNKGGMFIVEFTSDVGSIKNNYNLWNENETARKIAQQELSALCHATSIYMVDFKNDGAALRGAGGLMDIGFQKGHEPSAEKPTGGYVELKKVYDRNGNEPGKQPQQSQQQPNGAGAGAWSGQGGPAVNQGGFNPNQQTTNQSQGNWQQQTASEKPPWG